MNRPTVVALLLALAFALSAPPVAADERSDRKAAARLALDGRRLLEDGRVEEALAQFERSLSIAAHAKTLYLKAVCLDLLDRDLETARAILRQAKGDPALGKYAGQLPDLLLRVELKLRPVPLVVAAEGGGGRVFVDDRAVGETPYDGEVARGPHVVRVEGPGCPAEPQHVLARAGAPVIVTVTCAPPAAAAPAPLVATEPAAPEPTLRDAAPPPAPRDELHPAWFWATLGTGVALAVTGTGFLIQDGVDRSNARPRTATHEADWVEDTNAIVGGVTLGVGVGLAITSIFLYPDGAAPADGAVRVGAGPSGAVVGWTW